MKTEHDKVCPVCKGWGELQTMIKNRGFYKCAECLNDFQLELSKAEKYRNQTVIRATHRTQDLIPAFLNVLKELAPENYQQLMIPGVGFPAVPAYAYDDLDGEWWDSEEASDLVQELMDVLDDHGPEGCTFSAHPGDGSDFGFWENEPDLFGAYA